MPRGIIHRSAASLAAVFALATAGVAAASPGAGAPQLKDVAGRVGLHFRQGAFRFGMSVDIPAMMGGGLCWLDYDNDGWLDLFVVSSYSERDVPLWEKHGGLPRSALF